MWGEIRKYNKLNPASIRAEVIGMGETGWVIKREDGSLNYGISSHFNDLRAGQWVTVVRTGATWTIIGTATTAPSGGGSD